ncbi:MAG: magnesium transporter, partial [Acidimicrobiales bacterium]
MDGPVIYVSRLVRLPLLGADGVSIGRLEDVVLTPPPGPDAAPLVLGFVASVGRRRIFVNANRVGAVDLAGAHLRTGTVDLRRFGLRPGELLARASVLDRRVGAAVVDDLALAEVGEPKRWEVVSASLG